jgi:hypothetical protein
MTTPSMNTLYLTRAIHNRSSNHYSHMLAEQAPALWQAI